MEDTRQAARALRKARQSFALHVRQKAEERTTLRAQQRFERKGRGLKARLREAARIAEELDLSDAWAPQA